MRRNRFFRFGGDHTFGYVVLPNFNPFTYRVSVGNAPERNRAKHPPYGKRADEILVIVLCACAERTYERRNLRSGVDGEIIESRRVMGQRDLFMVLKEVGDHP